jgi:hypothetical protein
MAQFIINQSSSKFSLCHVIQVKKKSGKIQEDVLADKHENRGMWDSIKR